MVTRISVSQIVFIILLKLYIRRKAILAKLAKLMVIKAAIVIFYFFFLLMLLLNYIARFVIAYIIDLLRF